MICMKGPVATAGFIFIRSSTNGMSAPNADANIIINTTPVGMYPNCSAIPIDINYFPKLEGVVDAVYNPLCTNLVLNARAKDITAQGETTL